MSRIFAFTLGVMSATGGFLDIGDLVTDAQVGARFGLGLAWVTVLSAIGIVCFADMAGRIAMRTRRPPMSVARSRLGPRYGLATMLASVAITGLLIMAEISGVALAIELATSVHYLLWIPVVGVFVLVLVWLTPFEAMERVYGIMGLTTAVFILAVWKLGPDWSQLWESATTPVPPADESWAVYLFFLCALIGAQMTPYESDFFGSGAVESRWRPKDKAEMRVNVFVGFPLGALIAIAIQACAYLVFFEPGVHVEHLSQTTLPVAVALGKLGLVVAIVGVFAVTFGATLETLFAAGYDVSQYFGWSYGKLQKPVRASRFMTLIAILVVAACALALTTINPITVTIVAVVISGMLLPFMFVPLMLMANDRKVMGDLANGRLANLVGSVMIGVCVLVSAAALPLLIITRGGSG
ncbi:MAG TPA: divalent metal cation transporter [Solirubrobacteraceae bacterium]|nr:divalent metal cation transporter [Solirubrobacteraceae bacterium]